MDTPTQTAQALAMRARVILACADGGNNKEVGSRLGLSRLTVGRWRSRFIRPRFHVHFTPKGASWINQVERFFADLTNKQLRRSAHRSTLELERSIRDYIDVRNRNPKPFVWTKTADEILTSIERFCQRISGTGH